MDLVAHHCLSYDPDETQSLDRDLIYLDAFVKQNLSKKTEHQFIQLRKYIRRNGREIPGDQGVMFYMNEFTWFIDHYDINIPTMQSFKAFEGRDPIGAQRVATGMTAIFTPTNVNSEMEIPLRWMKGLFLLLPDYEYHYLQNNKLAYFNMTGNFYKFATMKTDEFNTMPCYMEKIKNPKYKCPAKVVHRGAESDELLIPSMSDPEEMSNSPPVPLNLSTVDPRRFVPRSTPISSSTMRNEQRPNMENYKKHGFAKGPRRTMEEEQGPPAKKQRTSPMEQIRVIQFPETHSEDANDGMSDSVSESD